MGRALAHRGPDDEGIYIDRESQMCGLAHRRLAVIDPQGGRQPLGDEEGRLWICYNGECYNFQELKKDLEEIGHRFRTNCDTEVVLHLYQEYGPRCVEFMRGMFAFAVWDQKKKELFLARDRMGQKPLYYGVHKGRFVFASECKAIVQTDDFPRRMNKAALGQYLLLGYVPAPMSGFADIRQLPPAHTLTITADSINSITPRRYWSIPSEVGYKGNIEEAAQQIRAELLQATKMRMISDVPLGAFLSGGLDSTIIVGLMNQAEKKPVKTCAIGFNEQLYNELSYARLAAERFGSDHEEQIDSADCVQTILKLSYFYDEPFADSSALPTFHLAHLARKRVTVALSGDGGDECFGGYDRYKALRISAWMRRSSLLSWLARSRCWEKLGSGEYRSRTRNLCRLMRAVNLPPGARYLKWLSLFDPDMVQELLSPLCDNDFDLPKWNYLADYFPTTGTSEEDGCQLMAGAMRADGNMYLPGDLNTKVDRASMSIGLELRAPFQDHKVVELAYSLPTLYRHNGRESKYVLRRSCSDLLPARINRRSKKGFGVPVGRWFRTELREMFEDLCLSSRSRERGYLNQKSLESMWDEHQRCSDDHGHRLWALLMLELWQRNYLEGQPTIPATSNYP